MTDNLLLTRSLEVVLDSEAGLVRALDQLDVSIDLGETFALVGESGCGKSMTALALMRLLPEKRPNRQRLCTAVGRRTAGAA